MAVGALEPAFYRELLARLGLDPADTERADPSTWPALRQRIADVFATRTRDEWTAAFAGSDACVAPVLSLTEAPQHPHLVGRGTFAPDSHGHPVPRTGPRLSATPALDPGTEPAPGADTTTYLLAHGFTEAEVVQLLASGAVVQA